jgi:hypothetical protein
MSVGIMDAVFKATNLTTSQKMVALALGDHASEDGTEARPGVAGLARKCALSERQVQRLLRELTKMGVIEVQRPATATTPTCYRFILDEHGKLLNRGDTMSPLVINRGDTSDALGVTSATSRGDTGVTQNVNESSKETSLFIDVDNASTSTSKQSGVQRHFEDVWQHYPRKVAKQAAFKAFSATVKARKATVPQLMAATKNYALTRLGEDESFTLHGATFFGPTQRWRDFVTLEATATTVQDDSIRSEVARREMEDLRRRRAEEHAQSKPMPESMKKFKRIGANT